MTLCLTWRVGPHVVKVCPSSSVKEEKSIETTQNSRKATQPEKESIELFGKRVLLKKCSKHQFWEGRLDHKWKYQLLFET